MQMFPDLLLLLRDKKEISHLYGIMINILPLRGSLSMITTRLISYISQLTGKKKVVHKIEYSCRATDNHLRYS